MHVVPVGKEIVLKIFHTLKNCPDDLITKQQQ